MNIVNLSLLCSVSIPVTIILSIVMLAIGGGAGIGVFTVVMNKKSKSANQKADKILADAHAQAEKIKKEQVELTNKEINLLKSTFEQENKERREEAKRSEERLYAREEMLSKRETALDKKMEELEQSKERVHNQIEALNSKEEALDELQANIIKELEKVSQMTTEQAKQVIIDRYTEEAKIDAVKIAKIRVKDIMLMSALRLLLKRSRKTAAEITAAAKHGRIIWILAGISIKSASESRVTVSARRLHIISVRLPATV